jgi:uncharacterized protein YecE (DUF72 family)
MDSIDRDVLAEYILGEAKRTVGWDVPSREYVEKTEVRTLLNDADVNDVQNVVADDDGTKIVVHGVIPFSTSGRRVARKTRHHPAEYERVQLGVLFTATLDLAERHVDTYVDVERA